MMISFIKSKNLQQEKQSESLQQFYPPTAFIYFPLETAFYKANYFGF